MENSEQGGKVACQHWDCRYRDCKGSYGMYETYSGPKRLCGDCADRYAVDANGNTRDDRHAWDMELKWGSPEWEPGDEQ